MANILLIEDMEGVRKAVSVALRRAGHAVTEATDGGSGIEELRQRSFDLVVTDILMPETDGNEVLMFLDGLPKRPPVVALSGGGSRMTSDTALLLAKRKADALLHKPFDYGELVDLVGRLLPRA
jgi:DNA-binding response OmpR family regulator